MSIWINCWDCGEVIQVRYIGEYSHRQICSGCKDDRAKRYAATKH
jgi:hypothetical protein